MPAQDDLLEKGFELACFIFPERSTALRILTRALNKLKIQQGREIRRNYWRDKHLKRGITRITRNEGDTLQWLIFFESDAYEKEQEDRGEQTLKDMVVRYIKILVRAGTAMSSFYVNIGLHRLLHSYSTAETQRLYETVTDRYPGADEYRRAKSALMGKLLARFGSMLSASRAQHGELKFEADEDSLRWASLAEACLKAFTPWSTIQACPVPSDFSATHANLPPQLSGNGRVKVDPNLVEINRCHAFIDPICCSRLAQALTFEPPEKKLSVPRFNMENVKNQQNSENGPSSLTAEERKFIHEFLSRQASQRRQARPESASIVVDGVQRVRVPLNGRNETGFVIEEGAELIELWSEEQGEGLLLAVHPIAYTQTQGIAEEYTTLFQIGGQRLLLKILPEPETEDRPRRAIVTLSSEPSLVMGWFRGIPALPQWSLAAGSGLLAVALLGFGWLVGSRTRPGHEQLSNAKITRQPSQPAQTAQTALPLSAMQAHNYRLVPDELITRGDQGLPLPVVSLPDPSSLITMELPVNTEDARKSFRATMARFGGRTEILMEDMLTARRAGSGWTVDFAVPSRLLEAGQDYTVQLKIRSARGTLEEAASYTFHTK